MTVAWGTHATVISPPELATRVRSIAATLVQRYPGGTTVGAASDIVHLQSDPS